jgi:HlyD family secretion protein
MSMQRSDTDGDGKLSQDEIGNMDERFRSRIEAADTNSDGDVTRAELTAAMKKMMGGGGAR